MKKIVFAVAILMLAAPAWAVDVSCVVGEGNDANLVTVQYDASSDDPKIRAFALDIELDGTGEFDDIQCLSPDFGYQIYPGSISVDGSGNVDGWGNCKCSGGYPGTLDDSNSMTVEMGSLYEAGTDPDPCATGDLVSFRVLGTGTVNVTLAVNTIRGGVVDEDADTVSPGLSGCQVELEPDECLGAGDPGYARWSTTLGKPDCWCYRRQCRGDIDGITTGPFAVAIPDLTLFKLAFNQVVVPQCDAAPVITGPYNFWTN
jgi:hypothetical protein